MSNYEKYVLCLKCNHSHLDNFDARTLNSIKECCPECGNIRVWKDIIKKWLSTSIWYKPKTWKTGYWKTTEENSNDNS